MTPPPLRVAPSLDEGSRALVFEDRASRELLRQLRRIAPSDATVLISGETGTGKEIVARYIHSLSRRDGHAYVPVNCGALSETLAESELFGHERGAFTGATGTKMGWFEEAHGGTLFLDEIGDLPLRLQVKLLRVLQEHEVVRLGSRKATAIDVRLIAATNVDLEEAVGQGLFREDLFFRLKVVSLRVPPLRERPGDILPLTEHFLRSHAQRSGLREITVSGEAVQRLLDHAWPGNVRELENVIHRAVLTCHDGHIEVEDVPLETRTAQSMGQAIASAPVVPTVETSLTGALERVLYQLFESGPPNLFDSIDSAVIHAAFQFCHKNQSETARLLGISRNILRARLSQFGLLPDRHHDHPHAT